MFWGPINIMPSYLFWCFLTVFEVFEGFGRVSKGSKTSILRCFRGILNIWLYCGICQGILPYCRGKIGCFRGFWGMCKSGEIR